MNSQGLMRLLSAALVADSYLECLGTDTPSLLPRVDDTLLSLGNGTNSFDLRIFGNTSSDYITWDASASQLIFTGAASISLGGVALTAAAEVVTATNVITAAENGSIFFLNSATEFVSTLPAPFLGGRFTFVVAAAPSGASYTVVTASSANIMLGHILSSQDAGGSGDSETTGGDTLSFVDGQAVVGDRADFVSDGTSWFVRASCKVVAGITITTAS